VTAAEAGNKATERPVRSSTVVTNNQAEPSDQHEGQDYSDAKESVFAFHLCAPV
jgi:hypothetical protein